MLLFGTSSTSLEFDFGKDKTGSTWGIINDGVMGGRSEGAAYLTNSSVVFTGTISLENNGGFSSLRAPYSRMDLSNYSEVEIRYKSSGVKKAFSIENDRRWWKPTYKVLLDSTGDEWKTMTVQLTDFEEYEIGRNTGNQLSEDQLDEMIRIGFITTEKKAGSFSLEIDYIQFR